MKAEPLDLLQRWFHAMITHPDGLDAATKQLAEGSLVEQRLTRSALLSARERLEVYAQAYHGRLVECLADVFPLVRRMTGEDGFHDLAVDYLQQHPSRSYTLGHLSRQFPHHLVATRPTRDPAGIPDWADFIIDLARFEQTVFEVFDGPGTEGSPDFSFGFLADLPTDATDHLVLLPNPSLHLLEFQFPINDFFDIARGTPPESELDWPDPEPSSLALTRRGFVVRRHALEPDEFALLNRLVSGQPLGPAIQSVVESRPATEADPGDILTGWFSRWASNGFFVGVR